jgi:hypothetical protein
VISLLAARKSWGVMAHADCKPLIARIEHSGESKVVAFVTLI